jgi:hypothetical protein
MVNTLLNNYLDINIQMVKVVIEQKILLHPISLRQGLLIGVEYILGKIDNGDFLLTNLNVSTEKAVSYCKEMADL